MIIAIDVGNTNIDVAFFQGYKLLRHFEFSTNRQATSYEYAINLSWLINNNGLKADDVEGAALASVVPPVTVELERAIRYLFEHPEEAKKMGENGRRAVEEKYNWENESKKLIKVYETLI
ncbi:MAG TPA: type III pantothenate kinase [bacterium]|nr:type III pantothenate kinase [bacterium]